MALDHDGLFKVIGKYVKTINTVNGYIAALHTLEGEAFVVLEEENLERYYANPTSIPDEFDSFQSQITGWISQLIINVRDIIQDRDYVIDQLNLYQYSVSDVLNALYTYMVDNAETIESSVVSLGGADVDKQISPDVDGSGDAAPDGQFSFPRLLCSRILDGVNSPGNNVQANLRYAGVESQLARSGTVYAELLDNSSPGSESAQLFTGTAAVEPYQILSEAAGNGPIISNIEAINLIGTNPDFTEWDTNGPLGWTSSGVITTNFVDNSGTGSGPLEMLTTGSTMIQKLEGLEHNTAYCIAAFVDIEDGSAPTTVTFKLRLRKLGGSDVKAAISGVCNTESDPSWQMMYNYVQFAETVDLTDIYIEIEYDAEDNAGNSGIVRKVVVAPVTYWNGLAWNYWVVRNTTTSKAFAPAQHRSSMVIANNDNGVFQTFFRKALNVQLPSADSPTIADTLAT